MVKGMLQELFSFLSPEDRKKVIRQQAGLLVTLDNKCDGKIWCALECAIARFLAESDLADNSPKGVRLDDIKRMYNFVYDKEKEQLERKKKCTHTDTY